MNAITLSYVQTLVDQLSPLDQARLLQYLMPKITRTVATAYKEQSSRPISTEAKNAWEQFFKIGDSLNTLADDVLRHFLPIYAIRPTDFTSCAGPLITTSSLIATLP